MSERKKKLVQKYNKIQELITDEEKAFYGLPRLTYESYQDERGLRWTHQIAPGQPCQEDDWVEFTKNSE